ncbi:hypothetical protein J8N05_45550 [Streptomyces sp. BH-SS-21]|uniref:Uncharacterized protein n=1 Tax=Streptomyces liliiviolaceus TaxID=2823109 RepID=A0A940Y6G5_9ACTN|nr:hypothetical protein [Streptomyces liliiviolaceus]MBQ0855438.1 hypothetical protein [Streptomyces liliiviolaceus]
MTDALQRMNTELEVDDTDQTKLAEADDATAVMTSRERQLAVSHWLLCAAPDMGLARVQWAERGITILACGGILSAVRVPASMVWAAAGTSQFDEVDVYLAQKLHGGPVFMDMHAHYYYALVPGHTSLRWRGLPGVACFGRDTILGVPAVTRLDPTGRSYWCVPMDSPGELCNPADVVTLIQQAQASQRVGGVLL